MTFRQLKLWLDREAEKREDAELDMVVVLRVEDDDGELYTGGLYDVEIDAGCTDDDALVLDAGAGCRGSGDGVAVVTARRLPATSGYEALAAILDQALAQAQAGKGIERHSRPGEAYQDQRIVQLGEWMDSTAFAIGQACKKALESTRMPADRARAELLGAINYLAAAVIVIDRRDRTKP